jgi:hypothetical protein
MYASPFENVRNTTPDALDMPAVDAHCTSIVLRSTCFKDWSAFVSVYPEGYFGVSDRFPEPKTLIDSFVAKYVIIEVPTIAARKCLGVMFMVIT